MKLSYTVDGAKIRLARTSAKLSQTNLAERIGAHVTSVSDWERGVNQPSPRHLASIARETGRAMEFFIGGEREQEVALSGETFRRRGAPGHADSRAADVEGAADGGGVSKDAA